MTETLLSIFPGPKDLVALEPEDLGGVLLELAPGIMQNGMLNDASFYAQLFKPFPPSYPSGDQRPVHLAIAEALSWLVSSGLLVLDPGQLGRWYILTKRAKKLCTRADVDLYRRARILPRDLLQPALAAKVWPLFQRGDHDVAVFQAFKEVEVAVRLSARGKVGGYPDDLVGVPLMRKAFHPETGPLTDNTRVIAEREGEMALFAGAIAHAKNPSSHRDVGLPPQEAARLIVLASHLFSLVEAR